MKHNKYSKGVYMIMIQMVAKSLWYILMAAMTMYILYAAIALGYGVALMYVAMSIVLTFIVLLVGLAFHDHANVKYMKSQEYKDLVFEQLSKANPHVKDFALKNAIEIAIRRKAAMETHDIFFGTSFVKFDKENNEWFVSDEYFYYKNEQELGSYIKEDYLDDYVRKSTNYFLDKYGQPAISFHRP